MLRALLLSLLLASQASAFELAEHKAITQRALHNLALCLPTSSKGLRRLVFFARLEDLNLLRKWSRASHYYNPTAPLQLRRDSAAVRVARLAQRLQEDGDSRALGGVLHYLQDMASPPHVVPVLHGASDHFEGLDSSAFFAQPQAESCERISALPDLSALALLTETAQATLETLSQKVTVKVDGHPEALTWAAFFVSTSYGAYGPLGDHFGEARFVVGGHLYEISRQEYLDYKQQLLQLAVASTERAIYHYAIRPAPGAASHNACNADRAVLQR